MNQTLEHVLLVEKWRRLQILYCQLKHKESKTELLSFLQLFICKKRSWKNYLDIVFYKVSSYFLKEWRGFSVNWHNCFWDLFDGKILQLSFDEIWRNYFEICRSVLSDNNSNFKSSRFNFVLKLYRIFFNLSNFSTCDTFHK